MIDMTDDDLDASLAISDKIAVEIEALFVGKDCADCVQALATVFGRAVARNRGTSVKSQISSFVGAVLVEVLNPAHSESEREKAKSS